MKLVSNVFTWMAAAALYIGSGADGVAEKQPVTLALLKESESTYREFRVEPPVQPDKAVVVVLEQELEDFLTLAARHNGYTLRFSSPVAGTLRNASLPMDLTKLMPRLANRFDIAWYMNNRELYVSRASKTETRHLSLEGLEIDGLRERLERSGINPGHYSLTIDGDRSTARLIGSPSHLDAIFAIASELRD